MTFDTFVEWAFMGAITGAAWLAVNAILGIRDEMREMQKSVSDLNSSVRLILDRTERHETHLREIEERVRALEIA